MDMTTNLPEVEAEAEQVTIENTPMPNPLPSARKKFSDDEKLKLAMTSKKILENKKGILAIDESPSSLEKKFEAVEIVNSEETRRKYREMAIYTDGLEKYIGGVILHEETYSQLDDNGNPLINRLKEKGISIGVKMDKGFIEFMDNEKISVGVEDLDLRCKMFPDAQFTKWRSLFYLDGILPTEECVDENCRVLAKFARISQENGLVPIVEPEISYKGAHDMDKASRVTKYVLSTLFKYLNSEEVYIPGMLLKMSYVTQGEENQGIMEPTRIALETLNSLLSTIPCGLPGIVFLSGGHKDEDAITFLKYINSTSAYKTWHLSFSYGRTLTNKPLAMWKGVNVSVFEAQKILLDLARRCFNSNNGQRDDEQDARLNRT